MSKGYKLSERLRILPGGAALIMPEEALVVADLHLGCEASLEAEGLSIPRVQAKKIQGHVLGLVESVSPSKVIVAGDLKHNFSRNLRQEWEEVSDFVESLCGSVEVVVVRGNHDNYLGSILRSRGVQFAEEVSVNGVRIVHGHEGSPDGRVSIMGHIHPSVSSGGLSGRGSKEGCFLYSEEHRTLVLPSLSLLAGGVDVLACDDLKRMSPILGSLGLGSFAPILFSGEKPLRFPRIGEMRNMEMV